MPVVGEMAAVVRFSHKLSEMSTSPFVERFFEFVVTHLRACFLGNSQCFSGNSQCFSENSQCSSCCIKGVKLVYLPLPYSSLANTQVSAGVL